MTDHAMPQTHAPCRVLMMAAGTGGHVFPALAVAQELQKQGASVHWLGTLTGMEKDLLADSGFIYHAINMQGLRGNGIKRLLATPNKLLKATLAVVKIIKTNQIDIVVGFGGYVTAPGGLAAKLTKKPLVIHEQNAIAGMSNRYLARMAVKVMQAFPNTFSRKKLKKAANALPAGVPPTDSVQTDATQEATQSVADSVHTVLAEQVFAEKVVTVGNPVREAIVAIKPPEARINPADTSPLKLLIVGGSLGAQVLNNTLAPTLKLLEQQAATLNTAINTEIEGTAVRPRWRVRHQCGKNNLEATQAVYDAAQLQHTEYEIMPFVRDMAAVYAWADIIVCRAGALTVTEIANVGLPAVFVPLPHAVDDHQTANARLLADHGAAILMPQATLTPQTLAEQLAMLDRRQLLAMAKQARTFAQPNATKQAAAVILAQITPNG